MKNYPYPTDDEAFQDASRLLRRTMPGLFSAIYHDWNLTLFAGSAASTFEHYACSYYSSDAQTFLVTMIDHLYIDFVSKNKVSFFAPDVAYYSPASNHTDHKFLIVSTKYDANYIFHLSHKPTEPTAKFIKIL